MKVLITAILVLWSINASAYLDPGTGSIIIQSAIATVAAAIFTLKLYWYRIKSWFLGEENSELEDGKLENDKENRNDKE